MNEICAILGGLSATLLATVFLLGAALLSARRDRAAIRTLSDEIVASLTGGFVMWDAEDRLVTCNRVFRETYSVCAPVLNPGTPFETIIRYGVENGQYPQSVGRKEEFVTEVLEAHRSGSQTTERLLPGGRWLLIHEERTASGHMIGIRSDITLLKRALADAAEVRDVVQHMAHHDAMTGLANRLLFRDRLETALSDVEAGAPDAAVLYLDLDRFKAVNDGMGHAAGDELLAVVAGRLRAAIRSSDLAARLGGDEFGVLLTGPGAASEARSAAARIIEAVCAPYGLVAGIAEIGVSVGIAVSDHAGESPEEFLKRADDALYTAKRRGRGAYSVAAVGKSRQVAA